MVLTGNSKVELLTLNADSHDSCVTDPPYELGFMGKSWDSTGIAYDVDLWKSVYRVLKPGGYLLAFGGSRTYHRMACAIEDAGFEIRDQIMWVYGCLSDDTEILTKNGWEQYRIFTKSSIFAEQKILIYDIQNDIYKWEVPERWNKYSVNKDTAYRIQSDNTDQIVSRGHRCLVERSGELVFKSADELFDMEYMPTLPNDFLGISERQEQVLQSGVQRLLQGDRLEVLCTQGQGGMERENFQGLQSETNGGKQSGLEGWVDVLQTQGQVCRSINQICEMPEGVYSNGTERWLCDGTQAIVGNGIRQTTIENGVCASHKPRCNGQSVGKFNAIQDECRPQTARTRTSYRTTLATVTEIEYSGIIFCPTVSTGAFVARRNGKVFLTGNSGFPKSLNVGKAVDALLGNERTEAERYMLPNGKKWNLKQSDNPDIDHKPGTFTSSGTRTLNKTKGTFDWEGWGTALKPAHENLVVARKPFQSSSDLDNLFVSLSKLLIGELCQLQSFALIVEKNIQLSQQEKKEGVSIAQWIAESNTNTQVVSSVLTDILQSKLETPLNWNIVSSWLSILVGVCNLPNISTTEMGISLTTDLKILHSLELGSIFRSIIRQQENSQDGLSVSAFTVVSLFNAVSLKLNVIHSHFAEENVTKNGKVLNQNRSGSEGICVARKPISEKTVAENCLKWGTGGINIDGCRVSTNDNLNGGAYSENKQEDGEWGTMHKFTGKEFDQPQGRFPANLIHDGSDEVKAMFPNTTSGSSNGFKGEYTAEVYGKYANNVIDPNTVYADSGSASRFFKECQFTEDDYDEWQSEFNRLYYCGKTSKAERNAGCNGFEAKEGGIKNGSGRGFSESDPHKVILQKNNHPTVKPISLMRYLCRLVTPKGGLVFDPFTGSGTTGIAAKLEGFDFTGIEMQPEYADIARARIAHYEIEKESPQIKLEFPA